jgi:hypothetical protein
VKEQPLKEIVEQGFNFKHFREHSSLCLAGEDKEFISKYMTSEGQSIFKPTPVQDLEGYDETEIVDITYNN